MNHDATTGTVSSASAVDDQAPILEVLYRKDGVPIESVTSDAIVQCLLIAARRGRQIRLAREQADQQHTDSPLLDGAEASPPNEA